MASITAVEFDGDTCAMARTIVHGAEVTVSAAELLHLASFPGKNALAAALRNSRRTVNLPRRCRVVLWGLPDGATPRDPGAAAALAPLKAAGFKVERVVTPCNALGALARLKSARGEGATCWVAINTGGVAIVAIRPGQQLYARSFGWNSAVGSSGSQARLLQRYSLVAFLSPEVKRAMAAAAAVGFPVRAVVTCGNLPDLRSLTMPLIEELDVEVETLDSLDGLIVKPAAMEALTETAAAIRIACAGAVARGTRPFDDAKRIAAERSRALASAAALILLLGGFGAAYFAYDRWFGAETPPRVRTTRTVHVAPRATGAPGRAQGTTAQTQPPAAAAVRGAPPADVAARAEAPRNTPPAHSATTDPAPSASPVQTVPAVQPRPAPPSSPATVATQRDAPPASIPGALSGSDAGSASMPALPSRQADPDPVPPSPGLLAIPPQILPSPRQSIGSAARSRQGRPVLLTDPMPRVTAILVSSERRLATVDKGRIVAVGDVLGRRVVVAIDDHALILREPSGAEIRVGLGGKLLDAGPGGMGI